MSRKSNRKGKKTSLSPREDRSAPAAMTVGDLRGNPRRRAGGKNDRAGNLAPRKWEVTGICVLLVILVFLIFAQTLGHGFVNLDDDKYVYDNPVVSRGLSLAGFCWAFTHVLGANWHPLTTLSHMCDCQFYGLWAGGHHLTNVLLHAAAAVLLFLMLRAMTGALWRCGFVAALFAIHPLRVESVAWVAERKDVLSGVFFMLTLWAYARYARRTESKGRYAMVLAWFALGLMSKPMMVTVPFVLLLIDYWPLGRLRNAAQIPGLMRAKIPLFALSVISCAATVIAQKEAMGSMERFPLPLRIGNALVAYVVYLEKLIFPSQLAVLYPLLKGGLKAWQVVGAFLLLGALTAGAYMARRKQPFLLVGWLWYLGMLVPVIGILQVGQQAYADRYTYLPQIGLCFAGTWAVCDWTMGWRHRREVLACTAAMVLSFLCAAAFRQTTYWQDSITLWTHTLGCTRDNFFAHNNLGNALARQGRLEEAIMHYREAVRVNPAYADAHNNLGSTLFLQGKAREAAAQYLEALQCNPNFAQAQYNLGNLLFLEGQGAESIGCFRNALRIDPAYAEAHDNLGFVLARQGQTEEAIAEYRAALEIAPNKGGTHDNLGAALLQEGRTEEAMLQYREALRINPADADARRNLDGALSRPPFSTQSGRAAK